MESASTRMFGIRHPVFAFSHSRAVVAAVSRAGGMGVYGAAPFSPERVDADLAWIASACAGAPFGIDVMMPIAFEGKGSNDAARLERDLESSLPEAHQRFVGDLLDRFGVPPVDRAAPAAEDGFPGGPGWRTSWNDYRLGAVETGARRQVEVALRHPVALIVTALGPPSPDLRETCARRGIRLGALVGSPGHATRQVAAGVDLVIAQGTEAAAHTGELSTLVLVPQIVDAVAPIPVLAAGGIATGRQAAAAFMLGAEGVWTGSIWLTTQESDEPLEVVEQLLQAGSADTVRSSCRTGKPLRQLRTPWSDAWAAPDSPGTLPMPTQHVLTADAEERLHRHRRADLMTIPVGQAVGFMNAVRSAGDVLDELMRDCEQTLRSAPARLGL